MIPNFNDPALCIACGLKPRLGGLGLCHDCTKKVMDSIEQPITPKPKFWLRKLSTCNADAYRFLFGWFLGSSMIFFAVYLKYRQPEDLFPCAAFGIASLFCYLNLPLAAKDKE